MVFELTEALLDFVCTKSLVFVITESLGGIGDLKCTGTLFGHTEVLLHFVLEFVITESLVGTCIGEIDSESLVSVGSEQLCNTGTLVLVFTESIVDTMGLFFVGTNFT